MEARITRKTAALAIFLISAFQTYIYAGRPSSCQLLIINSYTENCLWSDDRRDGRERSRADRDLYFDESSEKNRLNLHKRNET